MKTTLLAALAGVAVLALSACSARNQGGEVEGSRMTVPSLAADGGAAAQTTGETLLEQAKAADLARYEFALRAGATIVPTSDGRSFVVSWFPPGTESERPPVIATTHGHGSWAFDEFFLWYPYASARGYGIVALQWWDGDGERFQDYYSPDEVNREIALVLEREGVEPGTVMFHGFSRGAANSYAVVAHDRNSGAGYYLLAVANAGKASSDFPGNVEIERGQFGTQPLAGTNWVTYCGALDANPGRGGCEGMREAATWIARFGGTVAKAIEDLTGDHGGFHKSPANVNAALDVFAALLAGKE